jgi:hypothetical protein
MRLSRNKLKTEAKWTRKSEFLDEVGLVKRWGASLDGYTQLFIGAGPGIHIVQQWFNLSYPAIDHEQHLVPPSRSFVGSDAGKRNLFETWSLSSPIPPPGRRQSDRRVASIQMWHFDLCGSDRAKGM